MNVQNASQVVKRLKTEDCFHYTGSLVPPPQNEQTQMETAIWCELAWNDSCFHLKRSTLRFNQLWRQWINYRIKEIIQNYLFLDRNWACHSQKWNVPDAIWYNNHAEWFNGGRRPIRWGSCSAAIAIRYNGNMILRS